MSRKLCSHILDSQVFITLRAWQKGISYSAPLTLEYITAGSEAVHLDPTLGFKFILRTLGKALKICSRF